jgi:hypothetical protein
VIAGFTPGEDRIDLGGIGGPTFSAGGAFTGVTGQVMCAAGPLRGDPNGDGVADFTIGLSGAPALSAGALILQAAVGRRG